ncbi:MAG: hypothetical protein LBV46_02385 [Bacteroidales bacterium]|jgi:hypothetical protein|nr:hypothetical protein [Bacteroidales bacterium]
MCQQYRSIFLLLILIVFSFHLGYAQGEDVPLPKSLQLRQSKSENKPERNYKWMVGGNVAFSISNVISTELMPQVGIYPFKDWFLVGVNVCYMFAYIPAYKYTQHVFGGGFFVEGYPVKWLVLHAGYEYINYPEAVAINGKITSSQRIGSHAILVGPGYRQALSDKWGMYGLILFNVNQSEDAYYQGYYPIFKVGFFVKL